MESLNDQAFFGTLCTIYVRNSSGVVLATILVLVVIPRSAFWPNPAPGQLATMNNPACYSLIKGHKSTSSSSTSSNEHILFFNESPLLYSFLLVVLVFSQLQKHEVFVSFLSWSLYKSLSAQICPILKAYLKAPHYSKFILFFPARHDPKGERGEGWKKYLKNNGWKKSPNLMKPINPDSRPKNLSHKKYTYTYTLHLKMYIM